MLVSLTGNDLIYSELPLYEGFGGVEDNLRLLVGFELFIIDDPIIWDELTCYTDPEEGFLYGNASGCEQTNATDEELKGLELMVYPNPASNYILLDYQSYLSTKAEWSLYDAFGQLVERTVLTSGTEPQSISVKSLAKGIYFWKMNSNDKILGTGSVVLR